MRFKDRHDAGRQLARLVGPLIRHPAIVFALSPGGVPLAAEVALAHKLPIDVLVSGRVAHPARPEHTVCSVTDGGRMLCNPAERNQLDPAWLGDRLEQAQREAERRRALYGGGHPRKPATGQCAILVDDGVATGLTLEAAIEDIRGDRPSRIVVAVGVAPTGARERIGALCDDFIAAEMPETFEAIGAYYAQYEQPTDDDVLGELARVRHIPKNLLERGAALAAKILSR